VVHLLRAVHQHIESSHRLRAVSAVGVRFPLDETANGKAALDDTKAQAALDSFDPEVAEGLRRDIANIRRTGDAFDRDEHPGDLGDRYCPTYLGRSDVLAGGHSLFQQIGGAGGAFGGRRHLGRDLIGAAGILRSEDGPQGGDQRLLGCRRELLSCTDF
jgi:hypothetical protein